MGCVARFGVSSWFPTKEFPWATLAVNLVGAAILGALVLPAGMESPWRQLIGIGFLGGFTTLSTFSVETVDLARTGHTALAAISVVANGVGGPVAAWVGWQLAGLRS